MLNFIYYPVFMQRPGARNGQSPGKQVAGIRVVRDRGEPMNYGWALLRQFVVIQLLFAVVGSALCGRSQNMGELIAFRALQGIGGGGLMVGAQAIIADVVSPRERGRYSGIDGMHFSLVDPGGRIRGGLRLHRRHSVAQARAEDGDERECTDHERDAYGRDRNHSCPRSHRPGPKAKPKPTVRR